MCACLCVCVSECISIPSAMCLLMSSRIVPAGIRLGKLLTTIVQHWQSGLKLQNRATSISYTIMADSRAIGKTGLEDSDPVNSRWRNEDTHKKGLRKEKEKKNIIFCCYRPSACLKTIDSAAESLEAKMRESYLRLNIKTKQKLLLFWWLLHVCIKKKYCGQ